MSVVVQIIGCTIPTIQRFIVVRRHDAIQISLLSLLPAPPWRSKTNPFIPNDAFRLLETVAAFIPQDVFGMKSVERTTQFYVDEEYFVGLQEGGREQAEAHCATRHVCILLPLPPSSPPITVFRPVIVLAAAGDGCRRRISHSSLFHRSRWLVQQVHIQRNVPAAVSILSSEKRKRDNGQGHRYAGGCLHTGCRKSGAQILFRVGWLILS